MFKCKGCEILKEQNEILRKEHSALLDRFMALADARAFGAFSYDYDILHNNDTYGSSNDEFIEYDENGQKIIVKEKSKNV